VIERMAWWVSDASPEMDEGFMRAPRTEREVVSVVPVSQMFLESQVNAMTREGRRNGSRRSMRIVRNVGL
jgi:hypothetical protein